MWDFYPGILMEGFGGNWGDEWDEIIMINFFSKRFKFINEMLCPDLVFN